MAEPCDARFFSPCFGFSPRYRGRICGVGLAGDQKLDVQPLFAQQSVGRDQRQNAFVKEQPPCKADRNRAIRFGKRLQCVGIDAGAGDQGDLLLGDSHGQKRLAVVGILHQSDAALAPEQKSKCFRHQRLEQTRDRR